MPGTFSQPAAPKAQRTFQWHWLFEDLAEQPSYMERRMFGCLAIYLNGKLVSVLAEHGEEPWKGMMFPVEKISQSGVISEFDFLFPHRVLGKWLYLPFADENFEERARNIIRRISRGDPRFGTIKGK